MFTKTIASAIIASVLTAGLSTPSYADGGGGENPTFMTLTNPDGSSVTVTRTTKGRKIVKKDRKGNREVRRLPRRGTSWARNETTGFSSHGIRPGLRIVISPFGIGLSF